MLKKIGFMWIIIAIIILLNVSLYIFKPFDRDVLLLVAHILPNLCALIAVISLYLTFNSLKILDETKAAWLLLLIGIFLYFLGEFTYAYYEIIAIIKIPYPSLADGFRLAGYIFLSGGLIYLVVGFKRAGVPFGSWREFAGIGLLLGVIFCLFSLEFFIPVITTEGISDWEKILDIAYPAGDLLLIFLTLILLRITALLGKGIFSKPWKYMVAGFIFMGAGDLFFIYYTWKDIYKIGSYIDLFVYLGYLMIAMGALSQRKIIKSL